MANPRPFCLNSERFSWIAASLVDSGPITISTGGRDCMRCEVITHF